MKAKMKIPAAVATVLAICMCFCGCASKKSPPTPPPAFDATALPYYREDIDTIEYSYTEKERIIPFWQGNVMYNEQLMIVEKDGVTQGKLLYTPRRVISVRDWSLQKEYVEGADYVINGNTIALPEGSTIPVFKDEWMEGKNIPAEYPEGNALGGWQPIGDMVYTESGLIWKNYIHVTYAYDPADVDRTLLTEYAGELYGLEQKIQSDDPADKQVKTVVFGDSISEGCSSSKIWNHDPMCPPYAELVKYGLETFGGLSVELTNLSVGGKTSSWGADADIDSKYGERLPELMRIAPDLLILAFGTNDQATALEDNKGKSQYRKNIEKMIQTAKIANPECQILLVAPFPSREGSKPAAMHKIICTTLEAIAEETEYLDVAYVSMYEACVKMLETKQYYEIAANNINHPNDFIHRFYAMQILNKLIDFGAVATDRISGK